MFHFLCMYLPDSDLHAKSISDWHFYKTVFFSTNPKWAFLHFLLQINSNLLKVQKGPFSIFQHILISVNARFSVVYFGVLYSVCQ